MLSTATALIFMTSPVSWAAHTPAKGVRSHPPRTPIEHLIVIIGENQTFDGLFATYVPKPGSTVHNLLSEGVIDGAGNPGREPCQRTKQHPAVPRSHRVIP